MPRLACDGDLWAREAQENRLLEQMSKTRICVRSLNEVLGSPMNAKGSGAGREERLQIMLSPDELRVVDDFRFENRMPSRAAAVRELFRLGLSSLRDTQRADGMKSAAFGVLRTIDSDETASG